MAIRAMRRKSGNRSAVSFAMDDMDEIFCRVLDSTLLFLFWNNIDIGE